MISFSLHNHITSIGIFSQNVLYYQQMQRGVVAEWLAYRTQALVFLISRVWVRVPVVTLVSLSKTLNHYCFILRMGCKAVGPVCCVMHVKEHRALIRKEKGFALVFLAGWQQIAPPRSPSGRLDGSHIP